MNKDVTDLAGLSQRIKAARSDEQLSPNFAGGGVAASPETLSPPLTMQPATTGHRPGSGSSPKKKRIIFYLQILFLLVGATLLGYVVNRVGVQLIFDALAQIGLGFFALLGIIGVRHAIRALAMRTAFAPAHRSFNFREAFAARLGGETVTFLSFTGPLLGEATKAALLMRQRVPLASGVQALVIDNLLYNLSAALFILSGACVMLATYELPRTARLTLIVIASVACFTLVAVAFAVHRRMMPLTWMLERLARAGLKTRALFRSRRHVRRLEVNVYGFYRQRRGTFFVLTGLHFLTHVISVTEVYVTLRLLGWQPSLAAPYIIESLTKVINFLFGFVPGTIGVYEGGTEIILRALGFAAATGVTLGIVRKAGMIFWMLMGLVVLTRRTVPGAIRRVIEQHPRLKTLMDNLVLSNIAHRPARTFVSALGIGVGVLLIVFTVGLAHGILRERGRREAGVGAEIMMRGAGTLGMSGSQPFAINVAQAAAVGKIAGVRAAVAIGQNTVGSDSGFGMRIIDGIQFDDYQQLGGLKISEGRALEGGDEAIVDSIWKEQRQAKVGDTVQIYDRPFRIVGVYEPPGGARIKIPLATMQEQVGAEGRCTTILVACRQPEEQETVAARIREAFPDDQILFLRDLPEFYATAALPALNVFINVIVGVASAISMLVILLAMYTTVTERTRQIGILKSLGMSRAAIAWVIEQEALLVSLLGVVIGLILTFVARFLVMRTTSLTVDIETRWVLIALAIGLLGGTIGSLYPAWRAARQDAVDALSYE